MKIKSKNIALVFGFLTLLFLSYRLAISKTMDLKNEYQLLKKKEDLFKNTPKKLSLLKQKQKYYDSVLNEHQIKGGSIQNNLLQVLTSFSKTSNLKVVGFLEPHVTDNEDISVKVYRFTVQGNYNDILKLVHHFEQNTKFGEVINLHLEKQTDFRKRKKYLQAKVLLRSYG
ncbi:hypothetical protein [Hyunsoonleella flava]|nr:hypothetical protein [Hyunsoonleella flava]